MTSTLSQFCRFVALMLMAQLLVAQVSGQDYEVLNEGSVELETVAPQRSWEMKVIWADARGIRHKTKGWLMLVMDDAILVSTESATSRSRQQKIYARNIIKVKYKERSGPNPLPDIASSAVQGAFSGGFIPVTTGNIYLDLISGAVQGALGGLFSNNAYSRSINVDQRPDVYRSYVYPDLASSR